MLVGLVGGGFTFTGSEMPKVGGIARVLSFTVGSVLLVASLALVINEQSVTQPGSDPALANVPIEASAVASGGNYDSQLVTARVMVPDGYTAYVMEAPFDGAAVVTSLPNGTTVQIVCTAQGDSVTSPLTGYTSSLWNGTMDGGFIPDVYVDTGTVQPTMPNCLD